MEHYVSDKVVKEAAMFFGSHLVVGHKEVGRVRFKMI